MEPAMTSEIVVACAQCPSLVLQVPPCDCAPFLVRVLCCHTPYAVSTSKPALAWA